MPDQHNFQWRGIGHHSLPQVPESQSRYEEEVSTSSRSYSGWAHCCIAESDESAGSSGTLRAAAELSDQIHQ
jgi:hypothetical protein